MGGKVKSNKNEDHTTFKEQRNAFNFKILKKNLKWLPVEEGEFRELPREPIGQTIWEKCRKPSTSAKDVKRGNITVICAIRKAE